MKTEIERVREAVGERWSEQGECRSCGWHAALYEYDGIDEGSIDRERGTVELPCGSPDGSGHRGVRIDVSDVLEPTDD